MTYKVCKFGGTSLATADDFSNVESIIRSDPDRRIVVTSAPAGVTNLLKDVVGGSSDKIEGVKNKLKEAAGAGFDVGSLCVELDQRYEQAMWSGHHDPLTSFGDYASARILAARMEGAEFLDPCLEGKKENGDVLPDPASYGGVGKILTDCLESGGNQVVVVPGYYVHIGDEIYELPRGGSDTIGAALANAVDASVYENWTDVDGLSAADPRIVDDPRIISEITYRELRELAYMGFKLQEDSMIPVMAKKIPIHVLNSKNSSAEGTFIVHDRIVDSEETIVGVACKTGFVPLEISKVLMNGEVGFGKGVYTILTEMGISYEHSPTGIDDMTVIIKSEHLEERGRANELIRRLDDELGPLEASLGTPVAMVGVVGLGMRGHEDIGARILMALSDQGIRQRMLNQGATEISFFAGVDENRAEEAVESIHKEFFSQKND